MKVKVVNIAIIFGYFFESTIEVNYLFIIFVQDKKGCGCDLRMNYMNECYSHTCSYLYNIIYLLLFISFTTTMVVYDVYYIV